MSRIFGYLLLALLLFVAVGQTVTYYPRMPDRVASHFNADGLADGWSSKRDFFAMSLGLQFGMAAFLVGITKLAQHLPDAMINLPNKEYWLAPERRSATFSRVELGMVWIAAATAALMIAVFQLTIQANLENRPLANGPLFVCLAIYLGAIGVFCLFLYFRLFALPADETFQP